MINNRQESQDDRRATLSCVEVLMTVNFLRSYIH